MKICSKCKKVKDESMFYKKLDKRTSQCKECRSELDRVAYRKKNPIQNTDNIIINSKHGVLAIDVSTPTHPGKTMLVDEEDYNRVRPTCGRVLVKECGSGMIYCVTNINGKLIKFHKLIIDGEIIDHINGNTLNNRRNNLRSCTNSQNMMNRMEQTNSKSGFSGVIFDKRSKKWRSYIKKDGKQRHLGFFKELSDAVIARIEGEKKYFGEFMCVVKKEEV